MTDAGLVTLTVEVGPGVPAGVAVRMGGQTLAQGAVVRDAAIGTGAALRGQRMLVDAVVRNDNPQVGRVAARVSLSGGEAPQDWLQRADLVAGVMGRFSFTITFV